MEESTSTDPAWDEAFLRVEGYLRAYGLESAVLLNQIAAEIIHDARAETVVCSPEEPLKMAMEGVQLRIGAWFERSGADIDWGNERMRALGRLALVSADGTGRWTKHFLSPEPVPAGLAAAVTSFQLYPAPELHLSSMPPAPLEFSFDDGGNPYPPARKFWILARAVGTWLPIVGFFGIAWAASH